MFQRQKQLGVVTDKAELSPINPYASATSADGKGWPEADTVRPWDSLTDDEKRLFTRMAEVYAGFLSHADHEIGRLLDYLEQSGQLDNTIIVLVSDNGASGEGGPNGSVNENKYFNGIPDTIEANLSHLEDLGSPATYNHCPTGWAWAFNTPFKLWKRYSNFEGGTADPMIISWPAQITSTGLRRQYVHAIDIVPTLYSMLGIELPEVVKGYPQIPLEGISFDATFHDETATTDKQTQFYSLGGTRAIWHQGWKAAAISPAPRTRGRATPLSAGSCSTPTKTPASATTSPRASRRNCRSSFSYGGRRRASTEPCRWRTATLSRFSPPNGPS